MSTGKYCDRFDERLLDLLYGELSGEDESALREHAAGCQRCAASLAELELDRSMFQMAGDEEPPPHLDSPLLEQAARQAANWKPETPAIAPVTPASWLDRAQGVFDKLVGVALHPAFVSVSVLVVITVLAVFIQRQGALFQVGPVTEEPGSPALSRIATEEAPTSLESGPAEPLELKTERRAPAADVPASGLEKKQSAPSAPYKPRLPSGTTSAQTPRKEVRTKGASKSRSRKATPKKKAPGYGALDDLLGGIPGAGGAPSTQREMPKSSAARKSKAPAGSDTRFATPPAPSGAAPAEKSDRMILDADATAAPPSARELDDGEFAPAKEAAATAADDPLSRGTAAYQRGSCTTAKPLLNTVAHSTGYNKAQRCDALFMLGECARRRGSCSTAIGHYEALLRLDPAARRAPDALYNAAVCHHRLGQDARAVDKLGRLHQFSNWQDRAGALLQSIQSR